MQKQYDRRIDMEQRKRDARTYYLIQILRGHPIHGRRSTRALLRRWNWRISSTWPSCTRRLIRHDSKSRVRRVLYVDGQGRGHSPSRVWASQYDDRLCNTSATSFRNLFDGVCMLRRDGRWILYYSWEFVHIHVLLALWITLLWIPAEPLSCTLTGLAS